MSVRDDAYVYVVNRIINTAMLDPAGNRAAVAVFDSAADYFEAALRRVEAMVRLCYPDDMTPAAKRQFDRVFAEIWGEQEE